jgi:hypothetical protein
MKVLETKRARRAMKFYVNGFGFRQPYQIIGAPFEGFRIVLGKCSTDRCGAPVNCSTISLAC